MRKIGLIFAVVALVLAAAVLAGPRIYMAGAEERLSASTEALSVPALYSTTLESFEAGWFSSEAVSAISLSGYYEQLYDQRQAELNLPFDPPSLRLHHIIRHGPLIWTGDGPEIAASIVETTLITPEELKPVAEQFFGDQALLTIRTAISFDGTTVSTLASPPRIAPPDSEAAIIDAPWPGITGTISTAGKSAAYEALVPAWSLSGDGGTFALSPMKMTGNLERFRDVSWLGDFWLTMDSVEVKAGAQPISIRGIRYGGGSREEEGLVHASFEAGIESAEGQGARLGANAYKVSLRNLNADALAALYQSIYGMMENTGEEEDVQQLLTKLYAEDLPNLFRGSEILSLGIDVDFETPQMQMSGNSSLSLGAWDGAPGAQLDMNLGKTQFGYLALESGEVKATLTGLNGEALAAFWGEIVSLYAAALANPEAPNIDDARLEQLARGLIATDTKLTIDPFNISLIGGDLNLTAQSSLHEPETIDWDDPNSARQHLNFAVDAKAAEDALVRIIALATLNTYKTALAQQGLPSDTATALSYAEDGARAQLLPFVGQGLLAKDGESYSFNLRLERDRVFVNGTEIANPFLAPSSTP